MKLNRHKSIKPDEMHSRALRELDYILAKPISIMFEKLWWSGKVPRDWERETSLLFLKREERKTRNYKLVSLSFVPGKIGGGQIVMEAVLRR